MSQRYVLAPYVRVGLTEKGLELGFGSIQTTITNFNLHGAILESAAYFLVPHSLDELSSHLKNKVHLNEECIAEIISLFNDKNILMEVDSYVKQERYSRHKLFYNLSGGSPIQVQTEISQKHVVILGCGGIGNLISTNLVTAGIGQLTLIDSDVIEISNLTRQIMFTEEDVGKSKVNTLRKSLNLRNSNIKLNVIEEKIDSESKYDLIPNNDLVVVSGDSSGIMNHLNSICYRKKIPFINVGYIQDIAVWGPIFIPGTSACYECFSKGNIANSSSGNESYKALMHKINANYQAPSIGAVNMLASSLATLDILKFLGKFGVAHSLNDRIGLWTHNLEIEKQSNRLKPACKICIQ